MRLYNPLKNYISSFSASSYKYLVLFSLLPDVLPGGACKFSRSLTIFIYTWTLDLILAFIKNSFSSLGLTEAFYALSQLSGGNSKSPAIPNYLQENKVD